MPPRTKAEWRKDVLAQRAAMTPTERARCSAAAGQHLWACAPVRTAQRLAAFMARPDEVQTTDFIARCHAAGRQVCVPRRTPAGTYAFAWITPATRWQAGTWGIIEPVEETAPVEPLTLDVIIVPAVAVDAAGHRLGHGGGYYDRLLADYGGPRVALVFDCQRVATLPVEAHDQPLTGMVTESGYCHFNTIDQNLNLNNHSDARPVQASEGACHDHH